MPLPTGTFTIFSGPLGGQPVTLTLTVWPPAPALLAEAGDALLLETGDRLLPE